MARGVKQMNEFPDYDVLCVRGCMCVCVCVGVDVCSWMGVGLFLRSNISHTFKKKKDIFDTLEYFPVSSLVV